MLTISIFPRAQLTDECMANESERTTRLSARGHLSGPRRSGRFGFVVLIAFSLSSASTFGQTRRSALPDQNRDWAEPTGLGIASGHGPARAPQGKPHLESDRPLIGITMPHERATLASVMPARIARIIPKEGGFVNKGDVVVQLDDAIQQSRVDIARAAAESTLTIELTKEEWKRARRDLERLERLRSDASASSKELSDAMALAETRRIEYELARFNHEQAVRSFAREQVLLDEHRIRAPFAGYVIERLKHPGETVDQLEGIVTLYQLSPLKVFVDCPIELAGRINLGDDATITPVGPKYGNRTGEVVLVSPVTDPGSQTFRVKIVVDNQDGDWMAGMKVGVVFTREPETRARLIGDGPVFSPRAPRSGTSTGEH